MASKSDVELAEKLGSLQSAARAKNDEISKREKAHAEAVKAHQAAMKQAREQLHKLRTEAASAGLALNRILSEVPTELRDAVDAAGRERRELAPKIADARRAVVAATEAHAEKVQGYADKQVLVVSQRGIVAAESRLAELVALERRAADRESVATKAVDSALEGIKKRAREGAPRAGAVR